MNPISKKILIFDDNPIWLKTLYIWCRNYGFRDIRCIRDEEHVLNICKEYYLTIDVIIIDFYNGNKNTTELINKLRKINPNFLIIAISANFINDTEVLVTSEMMKAMLAGASRVCVKDISKLKHIIIEHLTLRESKIYNEIDNTKTYIFEDLGE